MCTQTHLFTLRHTHMHLTYVQQVCSSKVPSSPSQYKHFKYGGPPMEIKPITLVVLVSFPTHWITQACHLQPALITYQHDTTCQRHLYTAHRISHDQIRGTATSRGPPTGYWNNSCWNLFSFSTSSPSSARVKWNDAWLTRWQSTPRMEVLRAGYKVAEWTYLFQWPTAVLQ